MAAGPPRPSTPKAGGNKQALMDAFASAKSENTPPNEAPPGGPEAPDDVAGQPDPDDAAAAGGPPPQDLAPAVQAVTQMVQHLTNLLIQRGVIGAHDVMSPAPILPPGGMPAGGAPAGPPGGAPPQGQ